MNRDPSRAYAGCYDMTDLRRQEKDRNSDTLSTRSAIIAGLGLILLGYYVISGIVETITNL